jgi:hypothetical protein
MAFLFKKGRKSALTLRQVYPATLALERRAMPIWLRRFPFHEHRTYHTVTEAQDWTLDPGARDGPGWAGMRRSGLKAFPIPLNLFARLYSFAAAVVDPTLDRMLLAQLDVAKDEESWETVRRVLAGMNRAKKGTALPSPSDSGAQLQDAATRRGEDRREKHGF